jgi:NAD(P)H-hydrate epimerase
MSGSVSLTGLATLRGGAGLVTIACPTSILPIVAGYNPSYMTLGLTEDENGILTDAAFKEILSRIHHYDVLAIGPGLGKSPLLKLLIRELYLRTTIPLVIDADALNALASIKMDMSEHEASRILTPHPGEFSRLVNLSVLEINRARTQIAVDYANKNRVILLLKGEETLVTDGKAIYINETGNSGLATGGSGDVLTGLIAALLAQGSTPLDAAVLAAHLHGKAADIYASQKSSRSLIASDLIDYLGLAFLSLEHSNFQHFGNVS